MDELLKLLAGASMHLDAGEEALGEEAYATAADELDAAGEVLATLRGRWPEMSPAERTLVGRSSRRSRFATWLRDLWTSLPSASCVCPNSPTSLL